MHRVGFRLFQMVKGIEPFLDRAPVRPLVDLSARA